MYDVKSYLSSDAEKFKWCKHYHSNRKRALREICLVLVCFFEIGAQGLWAQGPRGLGPFLSNDSARRSFAVQLKLYCRLPLPVSWFRYNDQSDFKVLASRSEMITFMNKLSANRSCPGLAPWKPDSKDSASCLNCFFSHGIYFTNLLFPSLAPAEPHFNVSAAHWKFLSIVRNKFKVIL